MTTDQAVARQASHETAMHELMLAVGKYLNAMDLWDGSRKASRYSEQCETEMRAAYGRAKDQS